MSTLNVSTIKNLSGRERFLADAWVNFNGSGTVAIRASGNVSSITDNGTGDYTVNFTTSLSDANYAWEITQTGDRANVGTTPTVAAGSLRFQLDRTVDLTRQDASIVCVSVLR